MRPAVLSLVGIAALMVFGFVVLITALTYDESARTDKPRDDLAFARERRRQQIERPRQQRQQASSVARWVGRGLGVTLRTLAMNLALEWWPRFRQHARRSRWLSLESTTGQVTATVAASVITACLIVAFV